jgi:hypothetical protein
MVRASKATGCVKKQILTKSAFVGCLSLNPSAVAESVLKAFGLATQRKPLVVDKLWLVKQGVRPIRAKLQPSEKSD